MTTLRLMRQFRCLPAILAAAFLFSSCASLDGGGDSELADELAAEELDGTEAKVASSDSDSDLDLDDDGLEGGGSQSSLGDAELSQGLASEELGDLEGGLDLEADNAPAPRSEPRIAQEAAPPAQEPASQQEPSFDSGYSQAEVNITDIRYVAKKNGGTVVVETTSPASYHTREVPSQNQVVIEIANARLPEKLKRPYVTKDFQQDIAFVNAYQDRGSSTVRVVIQFRARMQPLVQQSGRSLMVSAGQVRNMGDEFVDSGSVTTAAHSSQGQFDDEGFEAPAPMAAGGAGAGAQDPRILPSAAMDPTGYDSVRFYGRPISIEVRDTPVRDVINLIAEQSGANIVLASEVDGSISLKLRQIPWDQALLIVMKTRNLGYVRQGSILRIAPYDSLQKETEAARRVVDAQKAAEPLRVKVIPVGYAKVEAMEKQISAFLTKDRGRAVADARTNSLVVTDTTEVLERISNLVRALDTPPLQVLIEGKVIEARETFNRTFGIQWGWTGQDLELGGISLGQNLTIRPGNQTSGAGLTTGVRIGTLDLFGDLSANLRLFEQDDLIKIVSSPRVVVLNNEEANIVQGTNIPVRQVTTSGGATSESVTFQPVEMRLQVTPQVTSASDIILQLDIKREFAGNRQGNETPDINKREAKTKVLVRNGQTAVVGGVYQSDSSELESGVPWLRRVPVLGWLFKQKSINNEKSELLVFLTPRILNAESIQKENSL
jgi:type IV pilus assembly protein PilQ